jgi:hypothetical protein
MQSNTNLQTIFNSFETGLKGCIKDEVKKQVEFDISFSEIEEEKAAVVESDEVSLIDIMEQVNDFSSLEIDSQ